MELCCCIDVLEEVACRGRTFQRLYIFRRLFPSNRGDMRRQHMCALVQAEFRAEKQISLLRFLLIYLFED